MTIIIAVQRIPNFLFFISSVLLDAWPSILTKIWKIGLLSICLGTFFIDFCFAVFTKNKGNIEFEFASMSYNLQEIYSSRLFVLILFYVK